MINCKIYRDIAITSGGSSDCILVDINVGIMDGLYVFNRDDIEGLVFKDDSRPDNSLFVNTIITSAPFYRIDATNINYTEEYEDHYYTQELTADIVTVRNEIEEIMSAAVHGKYVVAFKVVGNEHYKLIGWNEGLSLDDSLSISSEDNSFSIKFSGKTTYPMLEVDKSNFNLSSKEYEATYSPLFEDGEVVCQNGWAVAKYVVKVNAAGQALDKDNKLCQYTGLAQAAYKLSGVTDGNYYIVGTYESDEYIDGKPVKKYDTDVCGVVGTISVSPSAVTLCHDYTAATLTLLSSDDWELVTYPSYVYLSRTSGKESDQIVYVYGTDICGSETLLFRNRVTRQGASVLINNEIIDVFPTYTYPNGTTNLTIAPTACTEYSATTDTGTVTINDDGSLTIDNIPLSTDEQTVMLTLSMGTCEEREVEITILGNDITPGARAFSEWCEISE